MLEKIPTESELISLVGQPLFNVWVKLTQCIESKYEMDRLWNSGGKRWTYEYKYRRGGKTLCALYAKPQVIGLMIIFGQKERSIFEARMDEFPPEVVAEYKIATTYHDGKWMMFELTDTHLFEDMMRMLEIKRKPNKK